MYAPNQLQRFEIVRCQFRFYWIWRFGNWEIWHEGLMSKLFYEENDNCPAIGIPVPPRLIDAPKTTGTIRS